MSKEYVMVCPRCKSVNIDVDRSNALSFGMPSDYICQVCGHTGTSFPEVELSKLKKFEQEAKKLGIIFKKRDSTPKIDVRYGNFAIRLLWIIAPISMFEGLFLMYRNLGAMDLIMGGIQLLIGLVIIVKYFFRK